MNVEQLALAVEEYVERHDHVSYPEIAHRIFEANGVEHRGSISIEDNHNIVYWAGMSEMFADTMMLVERRAKIVRKQASVFTYLVDGGMLRLPIAKRLPPKGGFKKPRWLPVVFCMVKP